MAAGCIEPYPGPRPFKTEHAAYFRGRDREIADLISLLAGYRLVLLYGLSGVGKSSVAAAGVRPRLEAAGTGGSDAGNLIVIPAKLRGIQVLTGRVSGVRSHEYPTGDTSSNIYTFNLLSSIGALPSISPTARATLVSHLPGGSGVLPSGDADADADIGEIGGPLLLIIDQFEEVLTAYPDRWKDREGFFSELGHLLTKRPRVRVLLVAREEHVPAFERYGDDLPDGLRIRYRLERLRPPQASEAILRPAEKAALSVASEPGPEADRCRVAYAFFKNHVDNLIANLQLMPLQLPNGETTPIIGEFIEPLQLQIVCQSLWAKHVNPPVQREDRATPLSTDVEEVLAGFYANAIEQAYRMHAHPQGAPTFSGMFRTAQESWQRFLNAAGFPTRLHRWTMHELITPMGTRSQVYVDPKSGTAAGLPQQLVEALEKQHLIRSEVRGGTTWYELTHDRFIYAIDSLDRRRRKRLHRVAGTAAVMALLVVAGAAVWVRAKVDQIETVTQQRDEAQSALNAATTTRQKKAEAAVRYAIEGMSAAREGDPSAPALFQRAQSEDATAALQAIDGHSAVKKDPAAHHGRAIYMRGLQPLVEGEATDRQLRDVVCATPVSVVGASEPSESAQDELKRFQRRGFPVANLGGRVGRYQKIYVAQFVSCDEAAQLVASVDKAFRTGAFVENEFLNICKGCPGLPQSFSKPSGVVAPDALSGYRIGIYYASDDSQVAARAKQLLVSMTKAGFKGDVRLYPKPQATLDAMVPALFDQVRYDEPDETEAAQALVELLEVADKGRRYTKVRSWTGTAGFMSVFLAAPR